MLTHERLKHLLRYNRKTGVFTWRVNAANVSSGSIAGYADKRYGYVRIAIDAKNYLAHRLAWYYVKGEWPQGVVDHRDADRGNNSFRNLRDVSSVVNQQNRRSAQKNNRLGLLGVTEDRSRSSLRYRARICINGRTIELGCFASAGQAHAAYLAAKRTHHVGCMI